MISAQNAVALFIRQLRETVSYGIGVAYSTDFGQPFPLPVLAFNWNNGSTLSWENILPVSSELWYRASERLRLGAVLGLEGGNFRGDPDIFGVANPELRYSVLMVGPSASYQLSSAMQFRIDSGLIGHHRFEFFDGDEEAASFNVKPSAFLRAAIQLGG